MVRKCAKNVVQGEILKIAGTSFRVSLVGTHFDETTITLWPLIRTRLDNKVVLCIDKDQILKVHIEGTFDE